MPTVVEGKGLDRGEVCQGKVAPVVASGLCGESPTLEEKGRVSIPVQLIPIRDGTVSISVSTDVVC